jgi:hypothetical protein
MKIRKFFGSKIGENYAWDLGIFYKYRDFSDGIDFFIIDITFDKYLGDHKPSFEFSIKIFNLMVIDFTIYNIWHVDNPNSPYYEEHLKQEQEELYERDGPDYEKDNHD